MSYKLCTNLLQNYTICTQIPTLAFGWTVRQRAHVSEAAAPFGEQGGLAEELTTVEGEDHLAVVHHISKPVD